MLIIYVLISFSILLPINSINAECICHPDYHVNYNPTEHLLSLSDTAETIINTMFQTWDNLYATIINLLKRLNENNKKPLELLYKLFNDEYTAIFEDLFPNLTRIKQGILQFNMIGSYDRSQSNLANTNQRIEQPFQNYQPDLNLYPIRWPKYYFSLIPESRNNYYINYDFNKGNIPTEPSINFNHPLFGTIIKKPITETVNQPVNNLKTTTPSECLQEINNKIQSFIDRIYEKRAQFDTIADNLKQYIDALLKTTDNECGINGTDKETTNVDLIKLFPQYENNQAIFVNRITKFIQSNRIILNNKDELIVFLIKLIHNNRDLELIEAGKICLQLLYRDVFKIDIEGLSYQIPTTNQDSDENQALIILNKFLYTEDFRRLILKFTDKDRMNIKKLPTIYLMLILTEIDGNSDVINAASYILTKKLLSFVPEFSTKEELELYLLVFREVLNLTKDKSVIDGLLVLESDDEISIKLLNYIVATIKDPTVIDAVKFLLYIHDLQRTFNCVEAKHREILNEDYSTVKLILQTKQAYDYLKHFKLTDYKDQEKRFLFIITLMLDENSPIEYMDAFFKLKTYFSGGAGVLITKQLKLNLTKHFDKVFFKQLNQMTSEQAKDYAIVLKFITTHTNQVEFGDFDFNQNDSSVTTIKKFFGHLLNLNETIVPNRIKGAVDELIRLVH